ncbi:MAG: PIN domain nuclease, partial [Propionibacterium sp.]|nr:PIN domain nuclease [Propionibacterium sp.]
EVQGLLARRGQHRAPGIPDLLVAACGEVLGLTVLHLDKDFELIAEVTGQPVERLVDHSEGEQRPAAP